MSRNHSYEGYNATQSWTPTIPLEVNSSSYEGESRNPGQILSASYYSIVNSGNRFLQFCSIISVIAAIFITINFFLQLICLFLEIGVYNLRNGYIFVNRIYGLCFAVLAFFCEMEWTEVVRSTPLLQYWGTRGAFYTFIALFTLQQYTNVNWSSVKFFPTVMNLSCLCLLIVGIVYTIMGVACSRQIRDHKMARYIQMLNLYESTGYSHAGINAAARTSQVQSNIMVSDFDSYQSIR